jgi:hypothetical protein
MRAIAAAASLLIAGTTAGQEPPAPATPVVAEFRVFAGTEEISATTRLRIMPTGARSEASPVGGPPLRVTVPPGIYDVQALRMRPEGIVGIKWAERLVVMHYPDEGGRHLEVINFEPGYGALQLRASKAPLAGYDIAVFAAGEREAEAAAAVEGDDYRLFILEAGRYDVRVRRAGDPSQETHWILDVEVPADRTRLKQIDGSQDLNRGPSPADQVHEEQDDRDHQQHVDDPAGHVEREPEQPEQQQQDDERPEHELPLLRRWTARRMPARRYCRRRR